MGGNKVEEVGFLKVVREERMVVVWVEILGLSFWESCVSKGVEVINLVMRELFMFKGLDL